MARIRTIKPEFFTSSDILSLTPLSRLFYVSLWCESDREGRLNWNVQTLKFRYFPVDDCDIAAMGEELINAKLISIYSVDDREYAEIHSFAKHQVINNRESVSTIPPRVKVASKSRESGVQGEGKEGKERKGTRVAEKEAFETFWIAYPKKIAKQDAEKAFAKLNPDADLQAKILQAVGRAAKSADWLKEAGQFIPNAATWINGKRWEDGLTLVPAVGANDWRNDPRFRGAK